MKPVLVIVGAGLGGCFLADRLADSWDVTIVEFGSPLPSLQQRVRDVAAPAITDPHIGSGLGGTTSLWHTGLIEIDANVFREKWPFPKSELSPYYAQAYPMLSGVSQDAVTAAAETLRRKYGALGMPEQPEQGGLFYPRERVNAWESLKLKGRVKVMEGEAIALLPDGKNGIHRLMVKARDGMHEVRGDVFVLAAGGLGTPLLLQKLAQTLPLPALAQAGLHYEDHPSGFVGEVTLDAPLYKLWNYPVPDTGGNLRLPLVVTQDGLQISFQLRPAANYWINRRRDRVETVLSELRNQPLNWRPYFQLLTHWDDILEILSFKFDVRLPTRRYSLYMVAELPASPTRSVWRENNDPTIYRKWILSDSYIVSLKKSIQQVLDKLGDKAARANIFPDWAGKLKSSAHHSGTARMADSPDRGVCDGDGRVHGLENLYVCDGSLIPASGYANTGLTIAALALRMADHLRATR